MANAPFSLSLSLSLSVSSTKIDLLKFSYLESLQPLEIFDSCLYSKYLIDLIIFMALFFVIVLNVGFLALY